MSDVLKIKELNVSFNTASGLVRAVRGASLSVKTGEVLALVGESGCGKSVTARAVLGLNSGPGVHTAAAELSLDGHNILAASEKELLAVRSGLAGMIFQDPLTYLNPTMKVGKQVTEVLLRRGEKSASECKKEAVRLLEMVQIPDAAIRAEQYPHQFSGGMRQRAMIAMALACKPKLLIADEPTTALDPTIQLQILTLLKKVQQDLHTAILIITHDLSVVANVADRVAVMYAGEIAEQSPTGALFKRPAHPYTKGLLNSLPTGDSSRELNVIKGVPPSLSAPPKGCAFAPRCGECMRICCHTPAPMAKVAPGHSAACWLLHPDCPKGDAN